MQTERVRHYVERATDFLEGMKLTRTDIHYRNSSALLAVHSAVSYSDALRVGLGGKDLSSSSHERAVDMLRRLLPPNVDANDKGLTHFRFLLSKKNLVSYGHQRLEQTDYEALFTRAERFAIWADKLGTQLRINGWPDVE